LRWFPLAFISSRAHCSAQGGRSRAHPGISFGLSRSAAAAFDDYRCVAAVQQERLSREKSSGGVPWLAIDEVLQIAGWTRRDVDAIATTRSLFPTSYLRNSLLKEIDYSVRRWLGTDISHRELVT
jgi:predicted NodU family carbamoyl transferase